MNEFKEDDIVVRNTNGRRWAPLGFISKVFRENSNLCYRGIDGKSKTQMVNNQWRYARPLEIKAYNRGIRNINDIVSRGTYIQIY